MGLSTINHCMNVIILMMILVFFVTGCANVGEETKEESDEILYTEGAYRDGLRISQDNGFVNGCSYACQNFYEQLILERELFDEQKAYNEVENQCRENCFNR